jgi:hypothetical protein
MDTIHEEFEGVFYFTNPTDEERKYLWNNKEYTFPPKSRVPLIIPNETLENIQEIRKRFAYRMAEERFYESAEYKRMKDMGNGMPPTFDPKILEPMIEECLAPLPKSRAVVRQAAPLDDERLYKATKALSKNDDPNRIFAEDNQNIPTLGEMPE